MRDCRIEVRPGYWPIRENQCDKRSAGRNRVRKHEVHPAFSTQRLVTGLSGAASMLLSFLLVERQGIARFVVGDLKSEKVVHCLHGLRVFGGNENLPSALQNLEFVRDQLLEPLHDWNAGRHLVVNEHRGFKVAVRKHSGDVRQVLADLIAAFRIHGVVRLDCDHPTIAPK